MKKVIAILFVFILLACNNNPGESGVVDDGISAIDSNGALQDTAPMQPHPTTDSSRLEDRVDIQKRDSL